MRAVKIPKPEKEKYQKQKNNMRNLSFKNQFTDIRKSSPRITAGIFHIFKNKYV
jgi:hypothetical protein